ncbi:hypothetical protein SUGI_0246440 [Cryptomeria japonica]|nr:hypothetical protein SUGI_0246440 [Cryptomeria japonica]
MVKVIGVHYPIMQEGEKLQITKQVFLRWALIAGRIPGRTGNEIKNYWMTHLRKKLCKKVPKILLLDCNPVSNHVENTRKSGHTSHAEQDHVKNTDDTSLLQTVTKQDLNIEYNQVSRCHANNPNNHFNLFSYLDDCYTYFQGCTDTLPEGTKLMDRDIDKDWGGVSRASVKDCNHLAGFPLWWE